MILMEELMTVMIIVMAPHYSLIDSNVETMAKFIEEEYPEFQEEIFMPESMIMNIT